MPEEVELAYCNRLESRLDQLTLAITSLTKRLMGYGTGQAMEHEEESVHNVLTTARNTIVSIAKKVKDNVLCVITTPVTTPPSTMPKAPATKLLSALLRAPSIFIMK